jgi:hypothetical protein
MTVNTFVLSWDQEGLEAVVPVSEIERERTWQALKQDFDDPKIDNRLESVTAIVGRLMMRAKFNSHRHYEIYAIDVEDGITSDDVRDMFDQNPQASADLIRERGRMLYSDRRLKNKIKIE